ncbi:tryptophan synthase subunit alpha [Candidatus Peregrinibacteria bacterium]|nr:MAG: tryptophan synthase subunit alpha [Candidatus Peregrinibacteria bacterium]
MNAISNAIQESPVRPALMTHTIAGFPSFSESKEVVRMMDEVGADIIEIQIPFSDPVADGPTMMRCNEIAIDRGFRVENAFKMAQELSSEISTPLLFMTYYNIVFKRGVEKFCREAREVGIQGVIVPDMPPEEEKTEHFLEACQKKVCVGFPLFRPLLRQSALLFLHNMQVDFGMWFLARESPVRKTIFLKRQMKK